MKKLIFTLVSLFATMSMSFAQDSGDMITQPTQVRARKINANGEITQEMISEFVYDENGKLSQFECPDYLLSATFSYNNDFLVYEHVIHRGGHPIVTESNQYTYENGLIKTMSHVSNMGYSQYWEYTYDAYGRLEKKEMKESEDEDFNCHYFYDYENGDKTVIESLYSGTTTLFLEVKTTRQYDDNFNLTSTLLEKYKLNVGTWTTELYSTTQSDFIYTPSGMLDTKTSKKLNGDTWENTTISHYVYDANDRIIEKLDGSWDAENNDWNFTSKITFETSEDGLTYTVSFYKKNGDNWVWDTFKGQTILFESYLKGQQDMLYNLSYEVYYDQGNFNQIEFRNAYTNIPVYLSAEENEDSDCNVYPNPGYGNINIKAPIENAVIRMYDIQGKLMLARPFNFNTTINTENWPAGMYLWEIWHDSQKEACGKWVKE